MNEMLVLVDENDNVAGTLDKLTVHREGKLHRAFSVFIFNSKHELLLQQRAEDKYHSGGLWTNTCCSHPRHGKMAGAEVTRRLEEEMGLQCSVSFQFSFIYKIEFENGLIEHELDHVYFGMSDMAPKPDLTEVKDWKYMALPQIKEDIAIRPDEYSVWMKICLPQVVELYERR